MKTLHELEFDNSYARLPAAFYSRHVPVPLAQAHLVHFNAAAARLIDLDPEQAARADFVDILTGASPLPDFEPLAMCYAGHQFGHYVSRLGDGRALLLGEVRNQRGEKWDLQLKGSGETGYSRGGDGRSVLRSAIREYLCSEAMHGLGIPTTRALCITGSREEVYREQIETGAMLLRLAPSHVRFGTFEYFYYQQHFDELRILADHVLEQHFCHLRETADPYLALLREVIASTARLIAGWQAVGFAHGVMNTDNMSIHGITLDYGPYGFLDRYQAGFVCNHSDHSGRYAFDRQPDVALFNLSCLAQTLLPLLDAHPEAAAELAKAELAQYQTLFTDHYAARMRAKLGLQQSIPGDQVLCADLLSLMEDNHVDYTLLFRTLSGLQPETARTLFRDPQACDAWLQRYQARQQADPRTAQERSRSMEQVNPKYILRNHLAESAIRSAADDGDYSAIDRLMTVLQKPFDEHPGMEAWAAPPPEGVRPVQVSCSS